VPSFGIVGVRSTAPPLVDYSGEALEEPFRGTLESFTKAMAMAYQVHTCTELRQQIHDDLRIQHPEWVQPNGESPMCDAYEARLMELLNTLTPRGSNESIAAPHHALEQGLNRIDSVAV
jgi:hypothetical protein